MTPDLVDTIDSIYDFVVPGKWIYDNTGAEFAWLSSTLGNWFSGLIDRYGQINNWLRSGRPPVFWLAGFFNP